MEFHLGSRNEKNKAREIKAEADQRRHLDLELLGDCVSNIQLLPS